MQSKIPLSWTTKDIEISVYHSQMLPLSKTPWIYSAEIPFNYEVEDICDDLESSYPEGFLLRGCSSELVRYLNTKGHNFIRTGAEAVVDLNCLDQLPKSVAELASRGARHGSIKEIPLTTQNYQRVANFIEQTPYRAKPKLKYLFNTKFDSNSRCFVMSSKDDMWLGVLTVSVSAKDSCHTEMILRRHNAPVGVMEFLILSAMRIYKNEGFKCFSLGEVPFVTPEKMEEDNIHLSITGSLYQYFLFNSGNAFRYAFDHRGLFNFKDKFNPDWKPVYVCSPKLSIWNLLDVFVESGYFDLSRSQLITNIKTSSIFHQV